MSVAHAFATSPWSKQLANELSEKDFRDEYMMDQVRTNIAYQIRALREQPCRQWTQATLAEHAGTTQSVISRLENPDYGRLTLQTLLEVANAYDLPLLVQFVEWEDWLERMSDVSPSALEKRSFNLSRLLALANLKPKASLLDAFIKREPVEDYGAKFERARGRSLGSQADLSNLSFVPKDAQPKPFKSFAEANP